MIPVKVKNLSLSNVGPVVLLTSQDDERTLPIFIMAPEAQAILFALNEVELPRPMTHDLFRNVIDRVDAKLESVDVCGMNNGTF